MGMGCVARHQPASAAVRSVRARGEARWAHGDATGHEARLVGDVHSQGTHVSANSENMSLGKLLCGKLRTPSSS